MVQRLDKTFAAEKNATYHFQDGHKTLSEKWNYNSHDRLVFVGYYSHYDPDDPVQGADGDTGEMEDNHPLGALLETLNHTPSLWHLEPYTEDHVQQTEELVDDAS